MAHASTQWRIGDVIFDLYQVLDILGEGGFGKVYKVRHQNWNLDLAVKSPKPEIIAAAGGVESFEREAQTWVNLGLHPHTVSCYYVRRIESSPLVFAEYVAGGSLSDWIANRRLYAEGSAESLKRILDIAIQFCWGLHYAHERGLIHQDVKPANVMMTPKGVVKVTDFGLANPQTMAAILEPSAGGTLMVPGSGAMTPAYCSPEQANRETLTRRTDLWSWALSVLEMFQGERTWKVGTIAAVALESYLQIKSDDPHLSQMPDSVAELLRRCFQKNPAQRPHNLLEVADRLKEIYQLEIGEAYPRNAPNTAKDLADSLNNRAVSLLDLGKQEQALQLWEQALQTQPQHPEATYNRGLILWRTGKMDDDTLVRDLEQVRQSHKGNGFADYLLGLVHLERDNCSVAIETLKSIQGEGVQQQEVKAALALAQERLPHSRRLVRTFEGSKGVKGHQQSVSSVCLSADNQFVLSGSSDKTLKLWEVATGRCLRTFEGHTDYVRSVSLSTDGRLALSGGYDQTLKLWEVATGRCLRTFEGHTHIVESVCLSADSRLALSGSDDNTMKLWEVDTGRCLRTFEGHANIVKSVCFSADSRFALSGSYDKTLKLWEVDTGHCLRTFEGHTTVGGARGVDSVCLSADNRFALSGSVDKTLKLWDVATGLCLRTFSGHTSSVDSVCLSADNRVALSRDYNTLKLWNVATGRCLRTFSGQTTSVDSVCLSSDSQFAVSGISDTSFQTWTNKTLQLWAINGSTTPHLAPMMLSRVVATETILSINLTYERELELSTAAMDRQDYVSAAQHIRKARMQPGYSRNAQAFNAWANLYVCLPSKAFVGGWESAIFTGHTEAVNSAFLSADNRFILSGSADKTLKLWDVATGRCLRTFEGHTESVSSVCLSADNRFALSGGDDRLKLWEVTTGRCLRTFEGQKDVINSVYLSADCRFALSGSGNFITALLGKSENSLKLWEVATGRCLFTFKGHTGAVNSVCLSADTGFALSGSDDGTLKLWKVATGHCLRTFEGHTSPVRSVCLSANSRFALSGSLDGVLKLWEVATGRCLYTFEAHKNRLNSVCFSADSRFAVGGSDDNTLRLWVLDWELEDQPSAEWDEGARPYLENFLTLHMPYAASLPERDPSKEEINLALTRRGTPSWTEEDFQNLLYTLSCAGYGWLRSEGVRKQLEAMKSTPRKRRLVSLFTRRNRVALLSFLGSYVFWTIVIQSIVSLGWWGSVLLPVIPSVLFAWVAWYLSNLPNPKIW